MRRGAFAGVVGLGVFLLALAILLPTYVVPRVEKVPLDRYSVSVAEGSGAYLDPGRLEGVEGADVTVTRVTRGDVEASSDDVAVYEQSQTTEVEGLDAPLNVVTEKIVLDRESGIGTGGRGDRPDHTDAYTIKLPFNTKKGTYQLFDATAGKAFPIEFFGETEVAGLDVYEFRSGPTEPEIVRELGVPGSLVGAPDETTVFVAETYQNLGRVVYVEPRTGSIVGGSSHPRRVLTPNDIKDVGTETVVFDAEVTTTEESSAELVDDAEDSKGTLDLLGRTLPILFGLLGLVLIVVGLLLQRGRREPRHEVAY